MRSCPLLVHCEFREKKGCIYLDENPENPPCMYGLSKTFPEENINLFHLDEIEWGYQIEGVESFLVRINRTHGQERGLDDYVKLETQETQSLSKLTEKIKFVPFVEACDAIGIIDLKRLRSSPSGKNEHFIQAYGYGLAIGQMYDLETDIYVVIINRPYRPKFGSKRRMPFHIRKYTRESKLREKIEQEAHITYTEQVELLYNKDALFKEKEVLEKSGICDKCFEEDLCDKIFQEVREHDDLATLLIDERKVLPEMYYLRWSEFNKKCPIGRIYSKGGEKIRKAYNFENPPVAIMGTTMHALFNQQHQEEFAHNQTLQALDIEPIPRYKYCERSLIYYLNDIKITGHADAILSIQYFQ